MRNKSRKTLSILLTLALVFGLILAIPGAASAGYPDLDFTMGPGSSVLKTKLTGVTNGTGAAGNEFVMTAGGQTFTALHPEGYNLSSSTKITIGTEWPAGLALGTYVYLYEVDSSGLVVNAGYLQLNNTQLGPPSAGTTAITGGAGKVTVSSYAPVTSCTIYLVPSSLYPVGGGAIAIENANIKTLSANGDITGLSAGNYKLFTVYTSGLAAPVHGSYVEGTEVVVTSTDVCEINGTGYATLADAIADVPQNMTPTTIKLLNNIITSGSRLDIDGKDITFDLNGFILDYTNPMVGSSGLMLSSGAKLDLTGTGEFNVTGTLYGVQLTTGVCSAKVTNATATDAGGIGVDATTPGQTVTVLGNVNSTGYGVNVRNGATVVVEGNVTAGGVGVFCGNAGADAANVTINGTITAATYVKVNGTDMTMSQGVTDGAKPGYLKYTQANGGIVWVKTIAVAWNSLTANGTSGSVTTTALTLAFDVEPTTLAASDITVTGATKGALTATATPGQYTLAISNITVGNGGNVTVTIANPAGFAITPASRTVAVNVASGGGNTAPTLTGSTTMSLVAGYAATSTTAYTIGGNPAPTVTKTSGNAAITWNNVTNKLDIAAGLATGSYPVVLTATNGTLPNATLTFTLTVTGGGGYVGGGGGGGTAGSYGVSFDTGGGSTVGKQTIKSGETAGKPADPKREGYTFGGWYTDKACTKPFDFSSKITGATTLYAGWEKNPELTPTQPIHLSLNIGSTEYNLNGTSKTMDVEPQMQNGSTLVPVRFIAEALGATVDWDAVTRTVTILLDGQTLTLAIGQPIPGLGVTAQIINGRTMVPLRYISENLGCTVEYDETTRSITITRP